MDIQIKINKSIYNIREEMDILFEISEYRETEFSYSDNNENSYIIIETFSENKKKIVSKETPIFLNRSLNHLNPLESDEVSLPAGSYPIIYFDGEKQRNFQYIVKPSAINEEDLEIIKYHLENFSQGLNEDILSIKRLGNEFKKIDINSIIKLNNLFNESNRLQRVLKKILDNPINELKKEYIKQSYLVKVDIKICNYLCKNNINVHRDQRKNIFLNKKVVEQKNTPENIWLIQNLKEIKSFLNVFLLKFRRESESIKNKKKTTISRKVELKDKIDRLKKCNTGIINLNLHKNKLSALRKELKDFLKAEELIVFNISKIIFLLNIINEFIDKFDIKDTVLKKKINLKILNNPNYFYINKLKTKNINNSVKSNNVMNTFQSKQTFELYEYFCFIIIVDILEELEFKLDTDKEIVNKFENKINANEEYLLRNSNEYYIKLSYDKEIDLLNNDVGFRGNTTHNKPDFLISLYDKNNCLVKCIIIEVKCCLSKNIYNKNFLTKQYEQITSYTFYQYHFKDRIDRGIITKVIVLYPTQEYLIKKDKFKLEKFIDIKPLYNLRESEGYFYLKEELKDFVDKYMILS